MKLAVHSDQGAVPLDSAAAGLGIVSSLNGEDRSWLTFVRGGDELLIAGGRDGWYQVVLTIDDGEGQFDGVGKHGERGTIRMVTCGQRSTPKLEKCATRSEVMDTVEEFLRSGDRSAALQWTRVF